jgi:hypothetical protein
MCLTSREEDQCHVAEWIDGLLWSLCGKSDHLPWGTVRNADADNTSTRV